MVDKKLDISSLKESAKNWIKIRLDNTEKNVNKFNFKIQNWTKSSSSCVQI